MTSLLQADLIATLNQLALLPLPLAKYLVPLLSSS
jgi:hypothetical protein